jgi:DNA mismatch repair ATPase MutS
LVDPLVLAHLLDLLVLFLQVGRKDYFQVEEFQDVEVEVLEIQKDYFQVEVLLDEEFVRRVLEELPDFRQLVRELFQLVQLF